MLGLSIIEGCSFNFILQQIKTKDFSFTRNKETISEGNLSVLVLYFRQNDCCEFLLAWKTNMKEMIRIILIEYEHWWVLAKCIY